jgi:hypothetical protein
MIKIMLLCQKDSLNLLLILTNKNEVYEKVFCNAVFVSSGRFPCNFFSAQSGKGCK